jgi:hypothetical protein
VAATSHVDTERLEWLLEVVGRLPEYAVFATVDELAGQAGRLAERHPGVVELRRVGTSRLGDPLHCLQVGSGSRHALVFAFPHPNEPVGGLTAIALAELLAEDAELRERLDFTWHVIPCIDPDGTRLNEGWFHGPFTRTHYARHFYRPAGREQVDWTFPLDYKTAYFDAVMPETVALMRLIDEHRPAFVASLHNAESGGVYYYLSHEAPELYPLLSEVPLRLGLKLDLGEPESSHTPMLAPAIFQTLSAEDDYDAQEEAGVEPEVFAGSSSAGYAGRYGAFALIPELPYWTDPAADDQTPTEQVYADVLKRQSADLLDLHAVLQRVHEQARDQLKLDTPYLRGSVAFIGAMRHAGEEAGRRAGLDESRRPATVAEVHSCAEVVHMFRTRFGGMLAKALQVEVEAGVAAPQVREAAVEMTAIFDDWCALAEQVTPPEALPIRSLVGVQLGAVLACALHLSDGRTSTG